MDERLFRTNFKCIYNGFPVPDGMAITSPEFADHVWEQAKQGDERAVQAILGSEGKMKRRSRWTPEIQEKVLDRCASMPGPPSEEKVIEAVRQVIIEEGLA